MPTRETIRHGFIFKHLIDNGFNCLFAGPTGVGKTIILINEIKANFDNDDYMSIQIGFSAQSSANNTQFAIEDKINTKKRKNVFAPPEGKTAIIFIDDINMPEKEEYLAQPPIELLRQ